MADAPAPAPNAQKPATTTTSSTRPVDFWSPLPPEPEPQEATNEETSEPEEGLETTQEEGTQESQEGDSEGSEEGEEAKEPSETAPEKDGEGEGEDIADDEARNDKSITLKTKDGGKITVPKGALFPTKKDGKISWVPFNLIARQIDGFVNYSDKLNEVNQTKQKVEFESRKQKAVVETYESENTKRKELKETLQNIMRTAPTEKKLQALDHVLVNQIGVSPEAFMYEIMEYLSPQLEQWSQYAPEVKDGLRAKAELKWRDYQDQRRQDDEKSKVSGQDLQKTQVQVQEQIQNLSQTYNFSLDEWEKSNQELQRAKENGEVEFSNTHEELNAVFLNTMRTTIDKEVRKMAAREINPVFKDPAKAKELSQAMFELFRANPTKPKEWFLERAKEAFGTESLVKAVNKTKEAAQKPKPPKNRKQEQQPVSNWDWSKKGVL